MDVLKSLPVPGMGIQSGPNTIPRWKVEATFVISTSAMPSQEINIQRFELKQCQKWIEAIWPISILHLSVSCLFLRLLSCPRKDERIDWGIQMVPLLHPDMMEISYGERSVKVIKASLSTGVNPIKDVSMK